MHEKSLNYSICIICVISIANEMNVHCCYYINVNNHKNDWRCSWFEQMTQCTFGNEKMSINWQIFVLLLSRSFYLSRYAFEFMKNIRSRQTAELYTHMATNEQKWNEWSQVPRIKSGYLCFDLIAYRLEKMLIRW